ncbi:DUF3087 domain-containing protein [Vibrio sp. T187]|uniref:DUF3087 domain-containing protein n=1 Tax=Vibrio TaxID=662 RepID=UPI0010C9CB06|nr:MULTISPECIES: DUF3087 domain-containing protein [Vibrio]MBW3698283.1 DUF3087 domain-containing protein [Vibrio sp. T187]
MKLLSIEKSEYRKKINTVIVGFVASLAVLAVGFGAILISIFGAEPNVSGEPTGNFHLNLIGVILAVAVNSFSLNKLKGQPYLKEVVYIWELKHIHNRIYRKLKHIKKEAEKGNRTALQVLYFYYVTQKQVYELDNNTLTITAVVKSLNEVKEQAERWELELSTDDFEVEMINNIG